MSDIADDMERRPNGCPHVSYGELLDLYPVLKKLPNPVTIGSVHISVGIASAYGQDGMMVMRDAPKVHLTGRGWNLSFCIWIGPTIIPKMTFRGSLDNFLEDFVALRLTL